MEVAAGGPSRNSRVTARTRSRWAGRPAAGRSQATTARMPTHAVRVRGVLQLDGLRALPGALPTCRNEGITCTYIYTLTGIFTHGLLDLVRDHQPSFSTILAGNQIEYMRRSGLRRGMESGTDHRVRAPTLGIHHRPGRLNPFIRRLTILKGGDYRRGRSRAWCSGRSPHHPHTFCITPAQARVAVLGDRAKALRGELVAWPGCGMPLRLC